MGEGLGPLLRSELLAGRPSQAYLLTGHDAIRLRDAALALAQYLNCTAPGTGARPCGRCRNCGEAEQGIFADLFFGPPVRKIGEVREELGRLAQKPYVGRCRVAVLSDAAGMTREAHNALLKTLEDPPAAAALILLAPGPDALPATVVSRCRHIPVGGWTWREVSRALSAEGVEESKALFASLWAGEDLALARVLVGRDDFDEIRSQSVAFVAGAIGSQPEPPLELIEKHQMRLSNADEAALWFGALTVALRCVLGVTAAAAGGEDTVAEAFSASDRRVLGTLDPGAAAEMTGWINKAASAVARHAQARLSLEAALLADRGLAEPGPRPWPH